MNNAYSPYSGFKVGAALLTQKGEVFTGCNIENSSFTPTVCGERTAFFKAISQGETAFTKIAVVGGQNGIITDYCTPCGVCRQVMSEFCNSDFEIVLYDGKDAKTLTLADLLPYSLKLKK